MNFRKATTAVAVGFAIALGGAAPAHAASTQWLNYTFPAYPQYGYIQYGPGGSYRAVVGISPGDHVVKMALHDANSYNIISNWSQSYGNLCFFWSSPQLVGMTIQNVHSFAQQMKGYNDTNPTVC